MDFDDDEEDRKPLLEQLNATAFFDRLNADDEDQLELMDERFSFTPIFQIFSRVVQLPSQAVGWGLAINASLIGIKRIVIHM